MTRERGRDFDIMTGVHVESSVTVEKAREVGQSILDSMTGKTLELQNTHLQRVIKLSHSVPSHLSTLMGRRFTRVDPQLLFQRRIIACQSLNDMSAIFKYELCSYPPSLFDSSLTLKPQKPALADAIWAKPSSDATGPKGEVQCLEWWHTPSSDHLASSIPKM